MSVIKVDGQTSQKNGVARKATSNLIIGQQGRVYVAGTIDTLDSTNVAHLGITRVEHTFPYNETVLGADRIQYFDEPPIVMTNYKTGYTYYYDGVYFTTRDSWTPFDAKSTIWNDGSTVVEESRYTVVTPKYVYFCTLTIRRSGTFTGILGGGEVYYYLMFPTSTAEDSGSKGGPGTPDGTYLLYNYYTYDKDNELQTTGQGQLELGTGTLLSLAELDSDLKYTDLISQLNISE